MKKLIYIIFILSLATRMAAQGVWLLPDKFTYNVSDSLKINLLRGEGFNSIPSDLKIHEIFKLELHQTNKNTNLKTQFKEGVNNLDIKLNSVGTHLLILESTPEIVNHNAQSFNESLKVEGLDEVLYYRQKNNLLDKPIRELASFHSKLLFQVGDLKDKTYSQITGSPIEILIDRNPYNLKAGDGVRFKILFQGKPLFSAKVRIWNRHNNLTTTQNLFTLQDGTVETHISNAGTWLVSVVKMIPSKSSDADWESFRGALVFGVTPL